MIPDTVYTIGYGNRPIDNFISILRKYRIEVVCDVRSSPYSSRFPDYNQNALSTSLRNAGAKYIFLGEELGARPSDPDLYKNGRASYPAMANSSAFRRGIERIETGLKKFCVGILCAEKDPLDCHRAILIAPVLAAAGITVNHIDARGSVESHEHLESRLLRAFGLEQRPLFESPDQADPLIEAYRRRGEDLAYDIDAAYRSRYAK